jgi:pimeloyl-ACP methyl ester carboxylesterase
VSEPLALHVEHQGAGPPLVLAHGFGGSCRNFRPQARAFADRATVWLYDARGHARSPAPHELSAYQTRELVSDLASVATRGGATPVVGGLSLGAHTALAFALTSPVPLRGLILAAFPSAGNEPKRAAWAHGFADTIDREGLEVAGERYVWGETSRFDAKGAALIRQGFLEHDPFAMAALLRQVLAEVPAPDAIAAELARLHVPTLVIVGDDDHESLGPCRRLAELIPGAELVEIAGAGHVVNLAAPQAFNAALGAFLARLA